MKHSFCQKGFNKSRCILHLHRPTYQHTDSYRHLDAPVDEEAVFLLGSVKVYVCKLSKTEPDVVHGEYGDLQASCEVKTTQHDCGHQP